jgi:hypothetical protein
LPHIIWPIPPLGTIKFSTFLLNSGNQRKQEKKNLRGKGGGFAGEEADEWAEGEGGLVRAGKLGGD